jgi:hypothetical protein
MFDIGLIPVHMIGPEPDFLNLNLFRAIYIPHKVLSLLRLYEIRDSGEGSNTFYSKSYERKGSYTTDSRLAHTIIYFALGIIRLL